MLLAVLHFYGHYINTNKQTNKQIFMCSYGFKCIYVCVYILNRLKRKQSKTKQNNTNKTDEGKSIRFGDYSVIHGMNGCIFIHSPCLHLNLPFVIVFITATTNNN